MKIGICDDDRSFAELLETQLKRVAEEKKMPCQTVSFQSGAETVQYLKSSALDLLFLNVEMPGKSGIETAKEIECIQPSCRIAYCSNCLEYATDVYETTHCYYVLKKDISRRLPNVINRVLKENCAQKRKICVYSRGADAMIDMDDILFAERSGKKSYLYLGNDEMIETSERMDILEEKLCRPDFVRCHNSFIVCFERIKKYSRQKITMENGREISVSRAYEKKVKQAFENWKNAQ